jgi:uncharacterized membrane protein
MRTKTFLGQLDHDRIVRAIQEAEAGTSGQIRIYLQRGELDGDAFDYAQRKFRLLGMEQTQERNAVLIFVAPRARKFAVIGDEGVHKKCGSEFWDELVDRMRRRFQREEFTEALVESIESTGQLLARYFPKTSESANELPDDIVEGGAM